MFGLSDDSKFELTAQDKVLLQQTIITDDSPGTILYDFQVMLDYIQEKKPAATKNHQLSLKDLEPLNKRMTRPLQHGLKRPQQKSLPNTLSAVAGYWLCQFQSDRQKTKVSA